MTKAVTVYYSLASPWTFLAWARFRAIAAEAGADVTYRPARMSEVFAASGGLPLPQRPKQRQAYRLMELKRWREVLGIPVNLHPAFFPVDEALAARVAIAHGLGGGDLDRVSEAILRAVWIEERNIADPATLGAIVEAEGGEPGEVLAAADGDAVLDAYATNTRSAIEAGVFGAPTFVIGDELFWGQDRLDFVARALGV